MEPISVTQRSVEFAAPVSPWWLLLLVPAIVAGAWWLYKSQWKDVPRSQGIGLLVLRATILGLLTLLLFRPSLVSREVRTFPGVVALLVDDSGSMAAQDAYSDTDALWLARQLGRLDGPAHDLGTRIMLARNTMRTLERTVRDLDRDSDAFWEYADTAQADMQTVYEELAQQLPALAAAVPGAPDLTPDLQALRDGLGPFFSGDRSPSSQAYRAYDAQMAAFATRLYDLQAQRDRIDLADNTALQTAAAEIRAMPRIEQLNAALNRQQTDVQTAARQMFVQVHRLNDRTAAATAPLQAEGPSNLVASLSAIAEAPSDFPLAGIVLLSDGRAADPSTTRLTAGLNRDQTPLSVAAIGSTVEPTDVAILGVRAAPFAVQGRPFTVEVNIKTALPSPLPATVEVLSGTTVVTTQEVELGSTADLRVRLQVTPTTTGLVRYTARVSTLDGEVFPTRNNRQDFAVTVREDGVRVLLLDQTPRWETRFVLNIMQRLDYVDTNAIITVVQPNGELRRGVERGAWPQDLAALEIYDLVIIGDLPADTLSQSEWEDLRTLILEKGRTLCILGNGQRDVVPEFVRDDLLPTAARSDGTAPSAGQSDLSLTTAGAHHPLTAALRTLGDPKPTAADTPGLRAATVPLVLASPAGRPIISSCWTGAGQTILVDSDELWKRLNPTALQAHAALWMELANLSARRPAATDGEPLTAAPIQLLTPVVLAGTSVTAWLPAGGSGSYDLIANDAVIASAQATPVAAGASASYVTFETVPAGDFAVRPSGETDSGAAGLAILDQREFGFLAQDEAWLRALAADTAGTYASFTELSQLVAQIPAKQRVEKRETVWRLWDSGWLLAGIFVLLSIEWIWRKLVGLV